MTSLISFNLGSEVVQLLDDARAMPPSAYTRLLAERIPSMPGATVADIGTGSGVLGIVALLRGASRVYATEVSAAALEVAAANAHANSVQDRLTPVLSHHTVMFPLPPAVRFDAIVCNPASLPMARPDSADSPYYAGADGRAMIEELLCHGSIRLKANGRILLTHTSLADVPATYQLVAELGLRVRVITRTRLPFRPFYDRAWVDRLGGPARGLYLLEGGVAYEDVLVMEVRAARRRQKAITRTQELRTA